MTRFPKIHEPLSIRDLVVPNRIVFPPFVTGYSNGDGSIGERQVSFYRTIAKSGVGMVIVGASAVAPEGTGCICTTRIDRDEHIPGLTKLFSGIKAEGCAAGIQLYHCGLATNTRRTNGLPIVAPSALPYDGSGTAHELTVEEITGLEDAFAQAAKRAFTAGADFIEIHAAHGYLINQFLSPVYNKRTDQYGGTLENRARFALNIIDQTRKAIGSGPVIGIRVSAVEYQDGGYPIEDAKAFSKWMVEKGVDFVHVSATMTPRGIRAMNKGAFVQLASRIKEAVDVPVICVGAIRELGQAEEIVAKGSADLVAIGRALVADPELIGKATNGKDTEIIECLDCWECIATIFDDDGNGMKCPQNPVLP